MAENANLANGPAGMCKISRQSRKKCLILEKNRDNEENHLHGF